MNFSVPPVLAFIIAAEERIFSASSDVFAPLHCEHVDRANTSLYSNLGAGGEVRQDLIATSVVGQGSCGVAAAS